MKTQARFERERGRVEIDRAADVRVALAFPSNYSVGMASLGFQLVYRMLNDLPNASCERVFLPDPDDFDEHIRTHTELLSLESQCPLSEFDVVAFSISWELDYLNALRMLELANLPVMASERDESKPLVIAGGPCATFNPEPLADFVDAFVVGDAEEVLPSLISAIASTQGEPRQATLEALASVSSVYVPKLYTPVYDSENRLNNIEHELCAPERVSRAVCRDLASHPASSCVSTEDGEFGDITLVEVARGCGRGCRFCVAGHINRPPRARAMDELPDGKRFGLVGASVFDQRGSPDICRRIVEAGGGFTVSSLRLESITSQVAGLLIEGGQRTLTIAPEAGSERLRGVIGKQCSEDRIFEAVAIAQEAGFERVKLYFMVGLPTETDEDVDLTIGLLKRLAASFPSVTFQASVSAFVPKPWTPFQWHPMEAESVLKRRLARLSKGVGAIRGVSYGGESPRLAVVQGLLARGDRRVGAMLVHALGNGGSYPSAMRESGLDVKWYLRRQREQDEVLPWDHIDALVSKSHLWSEYKNALT
jgi:radical SAM superfamily enzyme YgiQ (UPF0313 family)